MTAFETEPIDDACYLAVKAKDARFDGRFFAHAAQAERAGFRPCLRCRPELAPRPPALSHAFGVRPWSIQDASRILADQAVRLLETPEVWADEVPTIRALARRLGVSDRHLRRIFEAQFGVSPMQYLQTRRLLTAKQLLTDTTLSVMQVACLSGFASVRRFNAAFAGHYALNPTQLRREGASRGAGALRQGADVKLAYRPPYDVDAMLQFFATRQITGIEVVALESNNKSLSKTVRLQIGGRVYVGWLQARFDGAGTARNRVDLRVSDFPSATACVCRVPWMASKSPCARCWVSKSASPQPARWWHGWRRRDKESKRYKTNSCRCIFHKH